MVRAVFALFACIAVAVPASAVTPCETLARLTLPGASVASAVSVPAGSFTPPAGKPIADLPAFCRVSGVIAPAADSEIRFEVWMPNSGWNGKFQGVGNGASQG
jgi:feruloyl esterase